MLPREKNGVVDPELRVYGTRNLRVADLSIVPLEIAAHTQATAYFVGEYSERYLLAVFIGWTRAHIECPLQWPIS